MEFCLSRTRRAESSDRVHLYSALVLSSVEYVVTVGLFDFLVSLVGYYWLAI